MILAAPPQSPPPPQCPPAPAGFVDDDLRGAADEYRIAFAASRRDRKPLVVFVGYVSRWKFADAHTVWVDHFDGIVGSGVVVGVWHGDDLIRTDLKSFTKEAVLAAIRPTASHEQAVANYLSQSRNVGSCPCGSTGAGCHCKPASLCGREDCRLHNPLLNPNLVAPVPATISGPITSPAPRNAVQDCPPGGAP